MPVEKYANLCVGVAGCVNNTTTEEDGVSESDGDRVNE